MVWHLQGDILSWSFHFVALVSAKRQKTGDPHHFGRDNAIVDFLIFVGCVNRVVEKGRWMDERFDDVRESLGRAMLNGDLMQTFLDMLIGSHPMIGKYFKHVDLERLKPRLAESLHIVILCAEDVPVGRAGINRLAKLHGPVGLDVNPDLYVFWIESFIRAISDHDPEFNDEVKRGWRTVLKKATSLFAPSATLAVV